MLPGDVSTSYDLPPTADTPPAVLRAAPGTPASPGAASMVSQAESCKEPAIVAGPATAWLFQMRVLFVRFVRTWYRTPSLLFSFLGQYIFAGIFLGEQEFSLLEITCAVHHWRPQGLRYVSAIPEPLFLSSALVSP